MAYRFRTQLLALLASLLSEGVSASLTIGALPRLADQYQCTRARNSDQTVDVLVNGSTQRFQGVARTHRGQLVEVAGVIGEYYPSAVLSGSSAAESIAAKADEEWQGFMIEMRMINKLIMERMKNKYPPDGGAMMGMSGGFGSLGMRKNQLQKDNAEPDTDGGPWGQAGSGMAYFGGGLFGVGYIGDELVTDQERAQIRQQAAQLAHAKRLKNAQKLESEQKRAEHEKIFAPPPPPPAPSSPPRVGDHLPPRPGDVIAQRERLGDIVAKSPRPGDAVMAQPRPGDIAVQQIRPGDHAFFAKPRPGDVAAITPRPGDMVTRGRGAVIGTANSLTFTALLDPATGRVVQILYREEQKASQEIRALTNLKSNDPLQGRVMEYVRRVQSLAACCERDAKPGCDQKFSPESQRALQVFRKETEAAIGDLDGGGAIFHPFAASAAQQANPGLARPAARPALNKPTTR